jgi:hypothetical protein
MVWTDFVWRRIGRQWRAQVNTAMNIRVPQKAGVCSAAKKLLASQELGSVKSYIIPI